ncbi:MAG TPA: tryptophan synthase subunit alpha [Mariprofundaceae bacterium]|nr:tryptophan synthase subunit alpha [Mariprofundaceae bacterium]
MNRLENVFATCKTEKRAALVGYLTAGDPDLATSETVLMKLAEQVDVLEIGMPFSDPMADGPVIQAASERALASGTHISDVFALTAKIRAAHPQLGIVLMGYANTPYAMGFSTFADKAAKAGADGVLLVDIPPEEADICAETFRSHGLHQIFLLSPTSTEERIKLVAGAASGFIYYVSLTGITGAEMGNVDKVRGQLEAIRRHTDLPICVGFGIKTAEQATKVAAFADGVVIGSLFVSKVAENAGNACAIADSVSSSAIAMRQAVAA